MTPQQILDPLPTADFLSSIWRQRFLHLRGLPGRFESLVTWHALSSLLEEHRFEPGQLRLVRESRPIPSDEFLQIGRSGRGSSTFCIDPDGLVRNLREGSVLVLNGINALSRPIGHLAEALERLFSEQVSVNLYAGWRESKGFDLHWDDHDVLVLQVSGRKRWRIYTASRPHPLFRDASTNDTPSDELAWEGVLEDGDLLYVPRGWWHVATAIDSPTIHLTFGILPRTGIDLLAWVQDELRAVDIFRHDLPRFASPEEQESHALALEEAIQTFWHSGPLLPRYFAFEDGLASAKLRVDLASVAADSTVFSPDVIVECRATRQLSLVCADDEVVFDALGKNWVFDRKTEGVFRMLNNRPVCSVAELAAAAPAVSLSRLQVFLMELLQHGLITISRSS